MPLCMFTAPQTLPDDPPTLQLILRAALAEIERLHLQLAGLQRNRFGRRSEKLDDDPGLFNARYCHPEWASLERNSSDKSCRI
jgi:hypothetical protein